jgi:hypothetical protein
MSTSHWTGNRDGHWYTGAFIEASASIHLACKSVAVSDIRSRVTLTPKTLHAFLWETARDFEGLQVWLPLNGELPGMLKELSASGLVRWESIDNPLSKEARILFVAEPREGA